MGRDHLCPLEPFNFNRLTKALPWEAPISWDEGTLMQWGGACLGPIWSQPKAQAQREPRGKGVSVEKRAHRLWKRVERRVRQVCGVEVVGTGKL